MTPSPAMQAIGDMKQALRQVQLPGYLQAPDKVGKCYEIYILDLVMDVASHVATNCQLKDRRGNATNNPIVRGSPGVLHSTNDAYTHAEISFNRQPALEAHVSIQFEGRSGVVHEADVVLVRANDVDVFRKLGCPPPGSIIIWAAECKRLGRDPDVGLAREALGLRTDLGPTRHTCVSNRHGQSWSRLLSAYGCRWDSMVEPGSNRSVARFRARLKRALQEYERTGR